MPAPAISGISGSGIDTKEMIQKLVELEKAPIARHELSIKELDYESKALQELRKLSKNLQNSLKRLSGFEAGFEMKVVSATPEGFVSGVANKNAKPSTHKLTVHALAAPISISSDPLATNTKIASGKIGVNGKVASFSGGSFEDLRVFFDHHFSESLAARRVMVTEKENILLLESKVFGIDGIPKFDDPDNILTKIGILTGKKLPKDPEKKDKKEDSKKKSPEKEKPEVQKDEGLPPSPKFETEEQIPLVMTHETLAVLSEAPAVVTPDGNGLILSKGARREYRQGPEKIKGREIKALNIQFREDKKLLEDDDSYPFALKGGPKDRINIKGIELKGYNIKRERDLPDQLPENPEFGIVLKYKNDSKNYSFAGKDSLQQVPIEKGLTGIEFYSQNKQISFHSLQWVYAVNALENKENLPSPDKPKAKPPSSDAKPKTAKDDNEAQKKQNEIFKNITRYASNAELTVDDVKIARKSNTDLEGIIDSVRLNLVKAGESEIKLNIKHDLDTPKKQIDDFVKAYNELITFASEQSKVNTNAKIGDFKENKMQNGILVSNATVRSLINGLRMKVSNAYPSIRDPHIKTLYTVGVHTGAIGSKWEDPSLKRGLLQVDEGKLTQTLTDYPEAVQDLFALDSNGDRRNDSGFAHETVKFLEPYARFTGGIITAQVKNNEERIKILHKEIKKTEAHAKAFENKMRQRMGYMESNVARQKAAGKYLKQRFGQKK